MQRAHSNDLMAVEVGNAIADVKSTMDCFAESHFICRASASNLALISLPKTVNDLI